MMAVGVDIGGTFTDLVGYRNGRIRLSKTLSTPADPTEGAARDYGYNNWTTSRRSGTAG